MTKKRLLLGVALLATVAWTGTSLAWFHDYFPAGADGSFDTHPDEGYAIAREGNFRLTKLDQHFGFMDFTTEKSDGPDRIRQDFSGDAADGVDLSAWIVGKKAHNVVLYLRDASNEFCNAALPVGTYLNEPVQILGFRVANAGPFNDRGYALDTNPASPTYEQWILVGGQGGCCAGYNAPLLSIAMNSPVAWRMGVPNAAAPNPYGSFAAKGEIGQAFTVPGVTPTPSTAEYWKVSAKDSVVANRNKFLQAGTAPFDPDNDGLGGYSGPVNGTETTVQDNMFAFEWLVRYSDAHIVNSQTLDGADCTTGFGGTEPRDIGADSTGAFGWYGVPIDRAIMQGMAVASDGCKGIVFNSIASTVPSVNTSFYGRDQNAARNGVYCAYLDARATYNGDCRLPLDGKVNVFDLSTMAAAWNTIKGTHPNYNEECDFNMDGRINVFDLNAMAANWNKTVPNEP